VVLTDARDEATAEHERGIMASARQLWRLGRKASALDLARKLHATTGSDEARRFCEHVTAPDGVSVILPTYKGVGHIEAALSALAAQTLAPKLMQIIVVQNGEDDGTAAALQAFRQRHPNLEMLCLRSDPAGAGRARNAGLAAATRRFATFVDDDDQITPGYLAALLKRAGEKTVAVARMTDVIDGQIAESDVTRRLRRACGPSVLGHLDDAFALGGAAFVSVLKLFPAYVGREVQFNTELTNGEDVVFWATVFARFGFAVSICDEDEGATYLRTVRDGSVSRQDDSFAFSVVQRLRCVKAIETAVEGPVGPVPMNAIKSQLGFAARYLHDHPERWEDFLAEVEAAGIMVDAAAKVAFPSARRLIVSYGFPPYADTAGIVMGKRVAVGGRAVDVVSNALKRTRSIDPTLAALTKNHVGRHDELTLGQSFAGAKGMEDFARATLELVEEKDRIARYQDVYSRAMWPASHYAAALIKLRHPAIRWVAEYSDPLALDIFGETRPEKISLAWLQSCGLFAAVKAKLPQVDAGDRLFSWAEVLPYALADQIVFTNENQRDYMLEQPWLRSIADEVRARSVVEKQPTLPPRFYEGRVRNYLNPAKVNIGYFGRFYKTRGLTEVLQAIAGLPEDLRRQILLHVHCPDPAEIAGMAEEFGVRANVAPRPMLHFLDFLVAMKGYDCLLVNDAQTAGMKSRNPYLPSKLSDYLGAGRPIWALAEAGSILHGAELTTGSVRSALGNLEEYGEALQTFVRNKARGAVQ
jgi:poly(ribitol-phosphate) beta-N-acetylglucosaminyltransferase